MDIGTRRTATIREAAKALGVGRNQLYQAIKNGQVPSIRIGKRLLVSWSVLERMFEEGHNPGSKVVTD